MCEILKRSVWLAFLSGWRSRCSKQFSQNAFTVFWILVHEELIYSFQTSGCYPSFTFHRWFKNAPLGTWRILRKGVVTWEMRICQQGMRVLLRLKDHLTFSFSLALSLWETERLFCIPDRFRKCCRSSSSSFFFFSAPETMLDPVRHPCVSPCLCNEGRLDRFSGKNKPGVFSCSSSFDVYRKQHSFPETLLELTGQSGMLFLEIRH